MAAVVEGKRVNIGDWVCFKSDIEQSGKIVAIKNGGTTLVLERESGFDGDYIGGETRTVVNVRDCWID